MIKAGFARILPVESRLRDRKYRNRLSLFFACLAIATFVWLVIKLSKDFTLSINWPVHYINVPTGKVLALKSDTTLTFQIQARGFDLLPTYFRGPSRKVEVDLSKVRYMRNSGKIRNAFLLTDDIKLMLADQLRLNEELVSIQPDTLFFQLSPNRSRKVPVIVPVEFTPSPSFALYGQTTVSPDSVIVSGPASLLDTLKAIRTKKISLGAINATTSVKAKLLNYYQKLPLSFSHQSFRVVVPIEKYTEATISVPVTTSSDTCRIKFFPEKVNLIILVAMRDYSRIDPGVFKLEVNCHDASANSSRFITPTLTFNSELIKVIRQEPPQVEFIILK